MASSLGGELEHALVLMLVKGLDCAMVPVWGLV